MRNPTMFDYVLYGGGAVAFTVLAWAFMWVFFG